MDWGRVARPAVVPLGCWLWAVSTPAGGAVPPEADRGDWDRILHDGVTVHCGDWKDSKWCQADAVLPGPVADVIALMADVEDLADLFPRMLDMRRVEAEIIHQIIDYPFPYDDRDIVARFTWEHTAERHVLSWRSVTEPPVASVGVRLTGAEGRFELSARPDGHTDLRYVWRGELGPGVPDWVRPFAWKGQAREVVDGLSQGLAR